MANLQNSEYVDNCYACMYRGLIVLIAIQPTRFAVFEESTQGEQVTRDIDDVYRDVSGAKTFKAMIKRLKKAGHKELVMLDESARNLLIEIIVAQLPYQSIDVRRFKENTNGLPAYSYDHPLRYKVWSPEKGLFIKLHDNGHVYEIMSVFDGKGLNPDPLTLRDVVTGEALKILWEQYTPYQPTVDELKAWGFPDDRD